MDIQQKLFFDACKQQDIKAIQQHIDNSFPIYLCQDHILELIVCYDLRNIYPIIMKHLREHPFNTIIIENQFLKDYSHIIMSYEFYILLTTTQDHRPLHRFLTEHKVEYIFLPIVLKLLEVKIPTNILEFLRDHFNPKQQDQSSPPDQKELLLKHMTKLHIRNNSSLVAVFETLSPETQEYFLSKLDFDHKHGLFDEIKEYGTPTTVKKYNLIADYKTICTTYSFDDAINVLCDMCNSKIPNFKQKLLELKHPKVIRTVKRIAPYNELYFYEALQNSYQAKNKQLIQFNKKIITQCFNHDIKELRKLYNNIDMHNYENLITDAISSPNPNQNLRNLLHILKIIHKKRPQLPTCMLQNYTYIAYEMYLSYHGHQHLLIPRMKGPYRKNLKKYLSEEYTKLLALIQSTDTILGQFHIHLRKLICTYIQDPTQLQFQSPPK